MITRQQVTDIITAALKAPGANPRTTDPAEDFAINLATALDALGLSQFCDIADPDAQTAASLVAGNARTPDTQQNQLDHIVGNTEEMVERRNRSADR